MSVGATTNGLDRKPVACYAVQKFSARRQWLSDGLARCKDMLVVREAEARLQLFSLGEGFRIETRDKGPKQLELARLKLLP